MEVFVSYIDLAKATKKYDFDMGDITKEQWLVFGENLIMSKEQGNEDEFDYMIENSAMIVKFREPVNSKIADSMIANINIEYLRENDECISLNHKVDINGEVDKPTSENSKLWRSIMGANFIKTPDNTNKI